MTPDVTEELASGGEFGERYIDLGVIGQGGMGRVHRVRDSVLNRVLALKILHGPLMHSPGLVARFVAEAQVTGQLQHPGIVAVHDRGHTPDGRPFYTMREVRGTDLGCRIAELRRCWPDETALRRLVASFLAVCEAMAYAHTRGVIHRDLKPANVIVGSLGEVVVVDWGIARLVDFAERPADVYTIVSGRPHGLSTQAGSVAGTPHYMSPEQAAGDLAGQGPHSDCWSLGAILYEILTGAPPFAHLDDAHAVQAARIRSPSSPGTSDVPAALAAVCKRALARNPSHRYPSATELAADVADWLESARRRQQALSLVGQAQQKAAGSERLRRRATAVREEATRRLAAIAPNAPVDQKRPGWQSLAQADQLDRGAEVVEMVAEQLASAALCHVPDLPEARGLLADRFARQLALAERRDDGSADGFEMLLKANDTGRHARYLSGEGAVSLVTDPPDALVTFERYERLDGRMVPVAWGKPHRTPLVAVELPMGSYRLTIATARSLPIVYPVHIGRGEHWDGVAPGASSPLPIRLPNHEDLDPDDVYVPAGWFLAGMLPDAPRVPASRVWVDGFIVRRFPTTQGEYAAFLDARRGLDDPLVGLEGVDEDRPVVNIDWHAANAYAAWRAERDGVPWRLPAELEREKAARGVDGRRFPWGVHHDPTWCAMVDSQDHGASLTDVTAFPLDESVYGARGMGGNTQDWCRDAWSANGPAVVDHRAVLAPVDRGEGVYRTVRGGMWDGVMAQCQCAWRHPHLQDARLAGVGVRLVRSFG